MEKNKHYIGTTEDRINKWTRMCLQWQFDKRRGIEKKASHYYTKYHVGKYPKALFDDLMYCVVDRNYVITKMNLISELRMKRDHKLGLKSRKVVLKQDDNVKETDKVRGVVLNDTTVVKRVSKSKYILSEISTQALIQELERRTEGEA